MGGINAAAYWIGDHLLRGADIVNDSRVTGTTVKAALNTLSAASTAVFPFSASGLAEQDLVSYDPGAATWRNRTKHAALQGTGTTSFVVGSGSFATGTNDIILGATSGSSTYSGTGLNIGIGTNVLKNATTTNRNTIVGHNSGTAITTGVRNTVLGGSALTTVASGQKNVAVGYSAMLLAEDAVSLCVGVGNDVLTNILAAAGATTAVGAAALFDLTSGVQNTAMGNRAGKGVTTGSRNSIFGFTSASGSIANADDNTFIGNEVGSTNVGSRNTVVGSQAFNSVAGPLADCVAIGYNCLTNSLNGVPAGCVGVGSTTLQACTTGLNTAVGFANQLAVTTGTFNTTLGYNVMSNASVAVSVSNMVGVGASSLAGALTTGANGAVAVGYQALNALTSGAGNSAIGYQAGQTLTTGSSNTIVGYGADVSANSRSGCVILGRGASGAADDTLVIRMGNSSAKEVVLTPVVTTNVTAAIGTGSYIPISIGGVSYKIELKT